VLVDTPARCATSPTATMACCVLLCLVGCRRQPPGRTCIETDGGQTSLPLVNA